MSDKKFDYNDTDRKYSFDDLIEIIAQLRGPGGCPWDIKQTHESLKECLTEESGEVIQAIDNKDDANLCEELGDVLLQVLMHSRIAEDEGRFSMEDVVDMLAQKLVRRHPHVFGDKKALTPEEGLASWEAVKRQEKEARRHNKMRENP